MSVIWARGTHAEGKEPFHLAMGPRKCRVAEGPWGISLRPSGPKGHATPRPCTRLPRCSRAGRGRGAARCIDERRPRPPPPHLMWHGQSCDAQSINVRQSTLTGLRSVAGGWDGRQRTHVLPCVRRRGGRYAPSHQRSATGI